MLRGLLNRAINTLSLELYIPGYQFDPGIRPHLEKWLTRDNQGIKSLDAACREHDLMYSHSNDLAEQYAADYTRREGAETHYREWFDSQKESRSHSSLDSCEG